MQPQTNRPSGGSSNAAPTIPSTPMPTTPAPPIPTIPNTTTTAAPTTPGLTTTTTPMTPSTPLATKTTPKPSASKAPIKPSSPVKKTLESLADAFLSNPSYRTTVLGLDPILKPPLLPVNEKGLQRLRTLVERRAWGDVLQVAGDMLRSASNPHSSVYTALIHNQKNSGVGGNTAILQEETAEILVLECHAWLKLRRYQDLKREVERWAFCRINDASAEPPTWVPWSLHILAAESLQYTDTSDPTRCIDELHGLRDLVDNEWVLRVDHALVNAYVRQKEWRLALMSLDNMLERVETLPNHNALQSELYSRQGRILLQAGAIPQARIVFHRAQKAGHAQQEQPTDLSSSSSLSSWIVKRIPCQLAMNDGLHSFATAKYDDALSFFQKATDALREAKVSGDKYCRDNYMGTFWVDSHGFVSTQTWNNMALSALYTCQMKDAVEKMETLIREDPTAHLTERLAFNLCTLYELGADTAASARKKRVLQLVAKRFFLHDIGPESFRLG